MRIVVTGGRDFADAGVVDRALSAVQAKRGITVLIQGGADGADRLCAEWCRGHGIPVTTYNADWRTQGKAAGPIRNQRMIDEGRPDGAIAFPGGRGTADMVARLHQSNVTVWDLRAGR